MTNTDKIVDINHNKKVAEKLQQFLDQSYQTLAVTQNLHWNIEGDAFYSLHKLTEEIYDEQFAAIDELAERLRALGHNAYINNVSSNSEVTANDAIAAQEASAQAAQELIEAAQEIGDEGTTDLAIARQQVHQKNAWMLKSQSK